MRCFIVLVILLASHINVQSQEANSQNHLTGTYSFTNNFVLQFKANGGKLYLIIPGTPPQEMEPIGNNRYVPKLLSGDTFYFKRETGDIFKLQLSNSNGTLTGSRSSGHVTDNTETMDSLLTRRKSAKHFEYWYADSDMALIDSLDAHLDANYDKILSDFGLRVLPLTRVKIYPDLKSFHIAINFPEAPSQLLATAFGKNEFRMVSPVVAGDDILKFALHEFVHCVHLNISYSPNNPRWLWEGIAMFESGWFIHPSEVEGFKDKKYPMLSELSNGNEYTLGYVLIEAIKDLHGFEKVIQLIREKGDIKKVFNLPEDEFTLKLFDHIYDRYIK